MGPVCPFLWFSESMNPHGLLVLSWQILALVVSQRAFIHALGCQFVHEMACLFHFMQELTERELVTKLQSET